MPPVIFNAMRLAGEAHAGQFRKYPNSFGLTEPFIMHPARVVGGIVNVQSYFKGNKFYTAIAAGWLHDVLEDTETSVDTIVKQTSYAAAHLVVELTNPSRMYKWMSREARKKMDRQHLAGVSPEAKIIKMIDRMDNLNSLTNAPDDFVRLYIRESEALAGVLRGGSETVHQALMFTIKTIKEKIREQEVDTDGECTMF